MARAFCRGACRGICTLAAALVVGTTGADVALAHSASHDVPRLRAIPATGAILVDGWLDEGSWRDAPVGSGFLQREPEALADATERTEVRVVYSEDTLDIGVHARDSEPSGIVARELGRDVPLFRDDSVVVLLDTFHDHRNAYFFETNPLGSRTDALVTDEGRDMNLDWDGVWTVGARQSATGWSAELAIPFATIRFEPGEEAWGLNVRRLIRRKEEEVFWAPIGLDADLFQTSRAGHLVGMGGVRQGFGLEVKPFVTGTSSGGSGASVEVAGEEVEAGLDLQWAVTRDLSLDRVWCLLREQRPPRARHDCSGPRWWVVRRGSPHHRAHGGVAT